MIRERGSALVWFLCIVLLLMVLGVSLMKVAHSDLRVSGHLYHAAQAQYAAEAGIELAAAVLGPLICSLSEDGWSYVHEEEPVFVVQADSVAAGLLRIRSSGSSGGLTETVEVVAKLRPLGRQALLADHATLCLVDVQGHLAARDIVFRQGESVISGEIRRQWLQTTDGGSYRCGHLCAWRDHFAADMDFNELWWTAVAGGWETFVPEGTMTVERLTSPAIYIDGDAELALGEPGDGLLAVRGDVTISAWAAGSRLVVVASGDVVLPETGGEWAGSLFVYSRGCIRREGTEVLQLYGALAGWQLDLTRLKITYHDEALLLLLAYLPQELLQLGATFDLEWLELQPRR